MCYCLWDSRNKCNADNQFMLPISVKSMFLIPADSLLAILSLYGWRGIIKSYWSIWFFHLPLSMWVLFSVTPSSSVSVFFSCWVNLLFLISVGSFLIAVSLLDGPACVIGFVYFASGINLIGDVSLVLLCDCICCINFCMFVTLLLVTWTRLSLFDVSKGAIVNGSM